MKIFKYAILTILVSLIMFSLVRANASLDRMENARSSVQAKEKEEVAPSAESALGEVRRFNSDCEVFVKDVNTLLSQLDKAKDFEISEELKETIRRLEGRQKALKSNYSKICLGVARGEPQYDCVPATTYQDCLDWGQTICYEFHKEIHGECSDAASAPIYYSNDGVLGVEIAAFNIAAKPINLTYIDQGPLYSPDTGEGNKYSHLLYTVTDTEKPATLLLRRSGVTAGKGILYTLVQVN